MGVSRCKTAFDFAGRRIHVGDVFDDSAYVVTAFSANFEDASALEVTGPLKVGTTADAASVKGIYVTGTIAVAVPSITDPDIAKVDVDISADPLTFAAAVGDAVIAIPLVALPTNCRLQGAQVLAADSIQVTFGSEGGSVTGANKNFTFLMFDLT